MKQTKSFVQASVFVLSFGVCSITSAEPKVNYVGDGRHVCHGTSAECVRYDQMNEMQAERKQRAYEREQERASALIERNRLEAERRQNRRNSESTPEYRR